MAIKDLSQLQRDLDDIQVNILGREARLAQMADADSEEGIRERGMISSLREQYSEIQKRIAQAQAIQNKRDRKTRWHAEQPAVDAAMDSNYMGYIAPLDQFIYCKNYGVTQSNTQFKMFTGPRILRVMSKLAGTTINSKDPGELIDYFEHRKRSFLDVTSSFNTAKWDESQVYNKMSVIRAQWLRPDYANAHAYDPRFDVLINSVAGGREENITHLEQWVAFKYLYPEKNANTPNIDLGGMPGGNGKGRFVEILKTIFSTTCVIQAHKEELDKFNANWEMAVVLYYDEPEEKELAAGKLKQATGSEDMRIEKKGIDATMADRNYNFLFISNNQQGVVKLSGGSDGGEDRRYSVINTDLVLFDLLREVGGTEASSRDWLDDLAQRLIKDPEQVSRWLAHIILKHNIAQMTVLPALHGEDYRKRFETQKDPITQAFDRLLPVFMTNGMIPQGLLAEAVRVLTDNDRHRERNVMDKFEQYLQRNRITAQVSDRKRYSIHQNGEFAQELQKKIIHLQNTQTFVFEWSTLVTKRYTSNPVTDALRLEHFVV